jgi:lysozyme
MLTYTLRKGDKGQEVRRLQSYLQDCTVDGHFGPKTDKALRDYQTSSGLVIDGLAGMSTLGSLNIEVLPGIDLSNHNGKVDFAKVAAAGIKYAWIKVTEGTTHVNRGFEDKFKGARDHGIKVGAYHFGRPDTNVGNDDVPHEVDNFLNACATVGIASGDLLPMLDVEAGMKTDDQFNVDWALEWLWRVQDVYEAKPVIYTARWAFNLYWQQARRKELDRLESYPLWLASYNEGIEPKRKTPLWKTWDIWQWSGSGSVPGVRGKCDQNWMAGGQLSNLLVP